MNKKTSMKLRAMAKQAAEDIRPSTEKGPRFNLNVGYQTYRMLKKYWPTISHRERGSMSQENVTKMARAATFPPAKAKKAKKRISKNLAKEKRRQRRAA